jgi:phage gpG-like protein
MPNEIEWTGSVRELDQLGEALERLSDPRLKRDLIQEVADEALKMVRSEFETSTDPYGHKWAPFVSKKDRLSGRKILKKSGDLKASIRRVLLMDGFMLVSDSPYFRFPQIGTKRMVQRLIFPMEVTTHPGGMEWSLKTSDVRGVADKFDVLMQQALIKVLARHDIDIFEESGGVSVFEHERKFRDNY